jgi:WD40 repeat protein/murein L,D-transpeptidase YafK
MGLGRGTFARPERDPESGRHFPEKLGAKTKRWNISTASGSKSGALLTLFLIAAAIMTAAMTVAAKAETVPFVLVYLGNSSAVNVVAVSADGRRAASGGHDNVLRLWDAPTGLLLGSFDAQTESINSVAFSPDGRLLLSAGHDNRVRLWDTLTGRPVLIMEGHTDEVLSAAFSPDGRRALSAGRDKTVRVWDLETGVSLLTLEGHGGAVHSAAFSPDGARILSASEDKTLKLWDAASGQLIRSFEGHTDEVLSAALSGDGALAVSAGKDKTIRLWNTATGQLLRTVAGHAGEVLSVAFSPGGRRVLSTGRDGTLKLWDAASGALIRSFEGHSDIVTSAVFLPGGGQILSGSWDKTLRLWNVASGQLLRSIDVQSTAFAPHGYYGAFKIPPRPPFDEAQLDARLRAKGMKRGDPVFLRIFKGDHEAEAWIKRGGRFALFEVYPICAWSGQLGPKLQKGDYQSPEGFYTISRGQLHPNSHYHRAFNLGFPNLFDRANKRTGAHLMMHGGCASVGCYAMTDPVIDEIWSLVTAALDGGQKRVAVHVFPFRMTEDRLDAFQWHPWAEFWRDLKRGYDLFETSHTPPQIDVCNKRYVARRAPLDASGRAPRLRSCPPGYRSASRRGGD